MGVPYVPVIGLVGMRARPRVGARREVRLVEEMPQVIRGQVIDGQQITIHSEPFYPRNSAPNRSRSACITRSTTADVSASVNVLSAAWSRRE